MRSRKPSPSRLRDAHHQPVGQHARAARDRGEVAARLAQHRRGFAGDGAFVDRGHAFDDFAVGGNRVVGLDQHQVAALERARLDRLVLAAVACRSFASHARALRMERSVAACALPRPSATASAKFANSTVNHSQADTCSTNAGPARIAGGAERRRDADDRRQDAADVHHEHHRIAELNPRIELRRSCRAMRREMIGPRQKCGTRRRASTAVAFMFQPLFVTCGRSSAGARPPARAPAPARKSAHRPATPRRPAS